MKSIFTLLLLALASNAYSQEETPTQSENTEVPPPPPEPAVPQQEDQILDYADEIAEYPGGQPAMREFLQKNINYPPSAVAKKLTGKCYLKFVVNKSGQISNVSVIRGVPNCPECDKEAVRVVKMMPKWQPARNEGKPVNCYFTLPIAFQL